MRTVCFWAAAALASFLLSSRAEAQVPFYLHDGDRVAFYGDSITAQAFYTVYVETAVHAAHPDWNITFVNAGVGGDRVDGGVAGRVDERLTRDVIARKPTVVTIMLGMNDRASEKTRSAYAAGYDHILQRLKAELPGARLTLIGPSPLDDVTRPAPATGNNADLMAMNATLVGFAKQYDALFVDFNAPGIAALQRLNTANHLAATLALPDRVHPEPGFHMLMAETLLRAWHFPAVTQEIHADVKTKGLTWQETALATTDSLQPNDANETLNRMLDALPHIGKSLLRVEGLASGNYTLRMDDRVVAEHLSAPELMAGLDLTPLPSSLHDQAKAIYYACSDSQMQEVTRMRLLARSAEPAITPHASEGVAFLDSNVDLASQRCRDAAAKKTHTWALLKE